MDKLFYIHLEKAGKEFKQSADIDFMDYDYYAEDNYKQVIDKNYDEIQALVKLRTGNFETTVYIPRNKKLGMFFCLVNDKNLPADGEGLGFDEDLVNEFTKRLWSEVSVSEGLLPGGRIDVAKEFISLKYAVRGFSKYYNFHDFEQDTILIGPPGCGKTTMLQMVTIDYLKNLWVGSKQINRIPVFIKLRKYNELNISFHSFLDNAISNKLSSYKFLPSVQNSGKLVVLLDGADEIDYGKFKTFGKTIRDYKSRNPFITFLISSRPDKKFNELREFSRLYVQPMEDNQIDEFVYKRISNQEDWGKSMAIYLFETKSILPLNTGQLLKELVDVRIKSWDSQRRIDRKFKGQSVNPNDVIKVLGKLSLVLSEVKRQSIHVEELDEYFPSFGTNKELEEFLEYVEFATSLVRVRDRNVEFAHKSLQDYFCSNYLVESVDKLKQEVIVERDE